MVDDFGFAILTPWLLSPETLIFLRATILSHIQYDVSPVSGMNM